MIRSVNYLLVNGQTMFNINRNAKRNLFDIILQLGQVRYS